MRFSDRPAASILHRRSAVCLSIDPDVGELPADLGAPHAACSAELAAAELRDAIGGV